MDKILKEAIAKYKMKDLAKKLGVSPRTIEGWKYRGHKPSGSVIKLLKILESNDDER